MVSSPFWATSQSDQLLFLNSRQRHGNFSVSTQRVLPTNQGTSNQELKVSKWAEKQSELRLKCSCPCSFATRWTHHVRLLEKVPTVPWILENGPVVPYLLVNTCALFRPSHPMGWRVFLKDVDESIGSQPRGFQNNYSWNNHLNQDDIWTFFGGFTRSTIGLFVWIQTCIHWNVFLIPSPLGKLLNLQLLDIKEFNEHVVELKKTDGWTARKNNKAWIF